MLSNLAEDHLNFVENPHQCQAWEQLKLKNGAINCGLTNMNQVDSDSKTIKRPSRSALDHSKYSGGSNGGAAGCVGAGILPFAIASDSEG